MDEAKKRLRDEVAELSDAVRELREELAAERASHHGHCCGVIHHWVYPPAPWQPWVSQPYVVTTTTSTYDSITTSGLSGVSFASANQGAVATGSTYLVNDSGVTCAAFNS